MTDEDRRLLRENNELLKVINTRLIYIQNKINNSNDDTKNFIINVIANALVGNR